MSTTHPNPTDNGGSKTRNWLFWSGPPILALVIVYGWLWPLPSTARQWAACLAAGSCPDWWHIAAILLLLVPPLLALGAVGVAHFWRPTPEQLGSQLGLWAGILTIAVALVSTVWMVCFSALFDHLLTHRWLYFVASIAPALLAHQVLLQWQQRPRKFGELSLEVPGLTMEQVKKDPLLAGFRSLREQLDEVMDSDASGGGYYGGSRFSLRFGVPALLLLIVGFADLALAVHAGLLRRIVESALQDSGYCEIVFPLARRGFQYGVAGGFTYVLLEFGRRAFRDNLTVGTAKWAIITLTAGPALAVILAIAWKATGQESPWQSGAVLFFAGFAPRRVADLIQAAAQQLLKASVAPATTRFLVPLSTLPGITAEIEERLAEEGIYDAVGLAGADPLRLLRDLPYDPGQILVWMDQACLAITLPKHRDALREAGVTGAIDLAWRWLLSRVGASGLEGGMDCRLKPIFGDFSKDVQVQTLLHDTARALFYDEHLRLIWVLYNCFSARAMCMQGAP